MRLDIFAGMMIFTVTGIIASANGLLWIAIPSYIFALLGFGAIFK